MPTVTVNHPIAGEVDVPLEIFKDVEKYNQFLLENAPDKNYGTLDVLGSQFKSGITSSMRGIVKAAEGVTDTEIDDKTAQERYLSEFEDRLQLEQNPVAAWTGLIAGSVVDPVTLPVAFLKPLKVASTVGTHALRGAAQGAFGGVVEPVYEEFGDSRMLNVAGGAVLGTGLGAGIGKLLSRNDANAEALANISTDAEKMIDEVAADIAKAEDADIVAVKQEIKDNDEMLPDFLPQKEARDLAIWEVRSELEEKIPFLITKAEEAQTKGMAKAADADVALKQTEVDNLTKALSGRQGKARKRLEAIYDTAVKQLEDAKAYRDELNLRLSRHKEAVQAELDIAALNKGNIPKPYKSRIDANVKANELARANYKERVKEQRLIKGTETRVEKLEAEQAKQEVELQRQQDVAAQEEGLPTGLDAPQTSASAAATRPSAVYNPEAVEGVDTAALTKAETTTKLEGDPAVDRGYEGAMTKNQRIRQTMRQEASSEQIASLLPVIGKYTNKSVAEAAARLAAGLRKSGDYDTLMDYLEERVGEMAKGKGVLSSVEREMLEPLFATAERELINVGKKLRSLSRKGQLDSMEGLEAVQDLQFYNYISDIDLANRASVSDALRQYKRVKGLRKSHASQVAAGKPVKNVFADINGRSFC